MPNTDKQPIDHKPPRPQTLDDLFDAYQGDYHPTEIDTGADVGWSKSNNPTKIARTRFNPPVRALLCLESVTRQNHPLRLPQSAPSPHPPHRFPSAA